MRMGVIGAGVIGSLRIQSIREDPATELVAVMDVSPPLAQNAVAGSGAKACNDIADFMDVGMDAVVVSTPPAFHEAACIEAFRRGVHVLCEKPLSNTVEAARRMVEAAQSARRVLAVGFNMRYYPFARFVRSTIDAGTVGDIDHVRVFGGHDGLHNFRAEWQYKLPASGGGAMMDVGIHATDLARFVLGDITSVYGFVSEAVWRVDGSEDNAIALFRSPDGIPASYQATWTEWKGYQTWIEVYGNRGMVRGSYAPMQNLLIVNGRDGTSRSRTRHYYPRIMIREKIKTWTSTALASFKGELSDFLARTRGVFDSPLADGHDGLRALEVAQAVRKSHSRGEPVSLPPLGRMRFE